MNDVNPRSDGSGDAGQGAGSDLLRALAGYPSRSVQLGARAASSRVVLIERNAAGEIVGSVERIERTESTDLLGNWLD